MQCCCFSCYSLIWQCKMQRKTKTLQAKKTQSLDNEMNPLAYKLHARLIKTLDPDALHSLLLLAVRHPSSAALSYARAAFLLHHPSLLSSSSSAFPFNTLIRATAAASPFSDPSDALRLFNLMRSSGVPPDLFTFPLLLKVCFLLPPLPTPSPSSGHRHPGLAVHALALKLGLAADLYVANTLVRLYGALALPGAALQMFAEMPLRDAVSWSAAISTLVDAGRNADALAVFRLMQSSAPHVLPDEITAISVASAIANLGALDLAIWLHCYVLRLRLALTAKLGTTLISMFASCGSMDRAAMVFERMPERNAQTWTAIIIGYATHGRSAEALGVFGGMVAAGLRPDHVTIVGVLTACSRGGLVDEGWSVFKSIERTVGKAPTIEHYGCMVDLMGRAGLLDEAHEFIKRMPMRPNVVIWRTLLGACVSRGDVVLAEQVKRRIMELEPEGQQHDGDYVLLSNVYGGIGRWEEKDRVRCTMRDEGVSKRPACSLVGM